MGDDICEFRHAPDFVNNDTAVVATPPVFAFLSFSLSESSVQKGLENDRGILIYSDLMTHPPSMSLQVYDNEGQRSVL